MKWASLPWQRVINAPKKACDACSKTYKLASPTLSSRHRPRQIFVCHEGPTVQLQGLLGDGHEPFVVDELIGFTQLFRGLAQRTLERPYVQPKPAIIQTQTPTLQNHGVVVSQEFPESVQRRIKGFVCVIGIYARPKRVGNALQIDLSTAQSDGNL